MIAGFITSGERERNVLFNDALNTFYLRLYGVRHMVKDHSDSEKGNPLPPHRLLFPINSKDYFIFTIKTDRKTHTTAFVTPVVEHWLEREIAQWVITSGVILCKRRKHQKQSPSSPPPSPIPAKTTTKHK